MASKFDEAVLNEMRELAPLNFDIAGVIADKHGLKTRAVVAAAVRNEIPYTRKARVGKTGETPVSKADLVGVIAEAIGVDVSALDGLDKANKTALTALVTALDTEA